MFCVDIPELDGNATYCKIIYAWEPRVTSTAVWIVPGLISLTVFIITMVCRYILDKSEFWNDEQPFAFTHLRRPYRSFDGLRKCLTMILIYAGLSWDCIDVTLDAKYFLDLENPKNGVLDPRVYRDTHALNAIYGIALIGILKIPLSVWLLTDSNMKDDAYLIKCNNSVLIFLAKDSFENFLEYFYGEKYSMD